jgi:large subunit ribosomal protein L20
MPRVKGGYVTRRRRKRTLKLAKGYFGSKHILYKTAHEQVMKSLSYAYRDRKQTKRNFRKLWIARINAACRMESISYSKFMHGLKLANIDVNRKMLADLAVNDLNGFNQLVALAKDALANPVKKEAVEVKEAVAVKEVKAEETQDLANLTVAELREIAKERGVTIPSGSRKADIVDLLSE